MSDRKDSKNVFRRLPFAFVVGSLVALSLTAIGCGDSGASQEELEAARKQGAAKARQQAKIHQIQKELKELKKGGGSAEDKAPTSGTSPAPENTSSGSGNCGGSLSANENTTCGFAENVEAAYYAEIGSGSGTVVAWSPTTEQYYSMYCTAGSPHECTGGNNAAVYFP
jgi:hypothetical protein